MFATHSLSTKNNEHTDPIQEAIYDFGGANVKSCASIALSKSISKGLVPPGTKLHQWSLAPNVQPSNNLYNIHDVTVNMGGQYSKS